MARPRITPLRQPANDGADGACGGVPPSANRKQWDDMLRSIFTGYTLVNWPDFNYGKCHTYEVLMPRGSTAAPGSLEEEQQLLRALGGARAPAAEAFGDRAVLRAQCCCS